MSAIIELAKIQGQARVAHHMAEGLKIMRRLVESGEVADYTIGQIDARIMEEELRVIDLEAKYDVLQSFAFPQASINSDGCRAEWYR